MIKLLISLSIILVLLIIFFLWKSRNLLKEDVKVRKANERLINVNTELNLERVKAINEINSLNKQKKDLEVSYNQTATSLTQMQNDISIYQNNMEQEARKAFNRYCEILDKEYSEKEQEYDKLTQLLYDTYDESTNILREEQKQLLKELEALRATRQAIIAAQIKEEEIKNNLTFYSLNPSDNDLNDIQVLNTIKPRLNKPRILSMLIWSTFFQKEMTNLCNNILGTKNVTGIYKITNQHNNKCYIGQSVDVAKRWKDHAKCGLGIDTPAGNKLYKDMQEFGIWSFSWEIIEECTKEELNDKERYYIELYQSKEYGYNTTKGVK